MRLRALVFYCVNFVWRLILPFGFWIVSMNVLFQGQI